jgi:hypothetical protein
MRFIIGTPIVAAIVSLVAASSASAAVGDLQLVSTSAAGVRADNGGAFPTAWSADDQRLLFDSDADNLTTTPVPPGTGAAFSKNVLTGGVMQVSPAGLSIAVLGWSDDGTEVLLGTGGPSPGGEVLVDDIPTGDVTVASDNALGQAPANSTLGGSTQRALAISGDGRSVLFSSNANNLTAAGTPCHPGPTVKHVPSTVCDAQAYVKDLDTGAISVVSSTSSGTLETTSATSGATVNEGVLSRDGTEAVFQSNATSFGSFGNDEHIYVKNLATGTLTAADTLPDGTQAEFSAEPVLSEDGTTLAFEALPQMAGPNGVFVRDITTGTVTLAAVDGAAPSLSADGRELAFVTGDSVDPADTNQTIDVYATDLETGVTILVSQTKAGVAGDGPSNNPILSADGHLVAFDSSSDNLDPAANDALTTDVYVKDIGSADDVSETAAAGGSVSTSGDPSPGDPVKTAITTPNAGTVAIDEVPITEAPPSGFSFLGVQSDITAPPASFAQPLQLVFRIDPSVLPAGVDATNVQIFRDDVPVAACADSSGTATPDPCVSARTTLAGGAAQITILSSHASTWNVGRRADSTPPVVTPQVVGVQGLSGWYTGNVSVSWSVSEPDSPTTLTSTGCGPAQITTDTAGQTLTCSASSAGGSTSRSVTIKRDATAPTLAFAGNGAYTVDQIVSVTCTAADPAPGAGLLANPCSTPLAGGPAYTFALGSNAVGPVTATDGAGNRTTKSTAFTVAATPASLCTLTTAFVQGSSAYAKLTVAQKKALDALAAAVCASLNQITAKLKAPQKAVLVDLYRIGVAALAATHWLTPAQASTLARLAGAL